MTLIYFELYRHLNDEKTVPFSYILWIFLQLFNIIIMLKVLPAFSILILIIYLQMQKHKKIISQYSINSKFNLEYRKILLLFNCNPLSIRIHFWLRTNWASNVITICLYFFWGSLCVFWRLLFLQGGKIIGKIIL